MVTASADTRRYLRGYSLHIVMRRASAGIVATVVICACGLGVWLLLSPNNWIVRSWRARQQELNAKVIVGPYPDDTDLQRLRSDGVTTIVSLLDPRLPYERVLLERERASRVANVYRDAFSEVKSPSEALHQALDHLDRYFRH